MTTQYKKCRKCKEEKAFISFWKSADRVDGVSNICKKCDTERRNTTKKNNKENENKVIRIYHKKKMAINDNYKTRIQMSQKLNKALVANSEKSSIVKDLGCSIAEFKLYLSSFFTDGMSWDNYGSGYDKWCLDHTIPLALFNLLNDSCYAKACHYSNIKPMWSISAFTKS
jgi:hypothetical protein